jgi:hypothetical protein
MYSKYNKLVFKHFFRKEYIGNTVTLSVDEELMTDLAKRLCISKDQLLGSIRDYLKEDWGKVLSAFEEIPEYLGLVAFQVYAAHQMQKKESEYTEKAYLPHLNRLFGFPDNYKIEQLFKKYQEKIWENLKHWAITIGFDIDLPQQKTGRYRFAQFPLSQALLNKFDLQHIPNLFKEVRLRPNENFSLKDFISIVCPVPKNLLTPHFHRVYMKYSERVEKQLFNFYQSWEGNFHENLKKDKPKVGNHIISQKAERSPDYLVLDKRREDNDFYLYIVDKNNDKKKKFFLDNPALFLEIEQLYKLPYEDVIIFAHDDEYNDWIETRFIRFSLPRMILIRKGRNGACSLAGQVEKICIADYSTKSFNLFEFELIDADNTPFLLKKYLSKTKAELSFKNGLKIGRNAWMEEAGPDIFFPDGTKRGWLNGELKIIDNGILSCRNLPVGEHIIKIPDHTPISFFIESPGEEGVSIDIGWELSRNPPSWAGASETPTVKGLIFETGDESNVTPVVRRWIEALMNTGEKGQNSSLPVAVNAIRRRYNGIRK